MKRLLQIIIFIVAVSTCKSNKNELQNNWIAKYSIEQIKKDQESIRNVPNNIFNFREDSLEIKEFYFDRVDSKRDLTLKYRGNYDTIFINGKYRLDTLHYGLSEDSLSLNYGTHLEKIVFEKIPEYKLAQRESEFYDLLISSSFTFLGNERVEFKENASLITPNFDLLFGLNQLWVIEKYKKELFLVVDDYPAFVLHINNMDTSSFNGTIYGFKNKEITFNKIPLNEKFNLDYLMGGWVQDTEEVIPPPMSTLEYEYFSKEHLYFNDSMIVKKKFFGIDTIKWRSNRERDLILLSEIDLPIRRKKWLVISLDQEKLILKRFTRRFNSQVEQVIFKKLETN